MIEIGKPCTTKAIDLAAENGHLDVVKCLTVSGKPCSTSVINTAALYGHLEVVKYLIENGKSGTSDAISSAAFSGHLYVVKYLMGIRKARPITAIDENLEAAKYLIEKGRTCRALSMLLKSPLNMVSLILFNIWLIQENRVILKLCIMLPWKVI